MLHRHFKGIVVVHEKQVFWLSNQGSEEDSCVSVWPTEQLLTDRTVADEIPKSARGNNKILCIVPDHWFGMDSFPFQAKKHSLIEQFLERKLATAYPDRPEIRDFFTYQWSASPHEPNRLLMYFLQEQSGYALCGALEKLNQTPRLITTPSFLWQARLSGLCPEFARQGTLFIHVYENECSLYFYSNGNYLFSRNVVLPRTEDRLETLRFEINQSLYMFSQKTKSEVGGYYVLADDSIDPTALGNSLGRTIVDLQAEISLTTSPACARIPLVNGLLPPKGIAYSPSVIGVTHRGVKRILEWEPAQRVGAVLGAVMCVAFFGESMYLKELLQQQNLENQALTRQLQTVRSAALDEHEAAVDHVLRVANTSSREKSIRQLFASVPSRVFLQEITFTSDGQNSLAVRAGVDAETPEDLRILLGQLVKKIQDRLAKTRTFSLDDIEIHWDPQGEKEFSYRYLIVFRVMVA